MWQPRVDQSDKPRYLALVDTLALDIAEGRLPPGTRLPTHRDLAGRLGVTVGTVSRAYSEAERRGLIQGEVGRGTFVRKKADDALVAFAVRDLQPGVVDLSLNFPATDHQHAKAMSGILAGLAARPQVPDWLGYQRAEGLPAQRAAGATWIGQSGLTVPPERVAITNGGQHALLVSLMALTKPGDTVLTEKLAYPGIKAIAHQLDLTLVGLELDEEGIVPESFETACRRGEARVMISVPTLQNPTAATMSMERRQRIADIARAHDIMLVEDDIYGFLLEPRRAPLAALAPERTYYVTSLSKCLLPSLRIGFLAAPADHIERIGTLIRSTVWMACPFMAEIAATWIADGTATRLATWQRREAEARQAAAARILHGWTYQTHPNSFHLWLPLPHPWRAEDFVHHAQQRGVLVTPADKFTVDRWAVDHAVRVCLSAAPSRIALEDALTTLAGLLANPPKPRLTTL